LADKTPEKTKPGSKGVDGDPLGKNFVLGKSGTPRPSLTNLG